jgi:branched-chain amino acid transport system permease protein
VDATTFIQLLINGVLLGGLYMLFSTGLNLIYGVMRLINYAHGEFLMLSMYIIYWVFYLWRFDPYSFLPVIFLAMFLLGYLLYWILLRRIVRLPYSAQIMVFVGLIFILQNLALWLWGADYRSLNIPYVYKPLIIGDIRIPLGRALALALGISIYILLHLFLHKTTLGVFIRAVSQDRAASTIVGLHVDRITAITVGISLALAGVTGSLILPIYYVYPYVGSDFVILGFIIITLGGLGNMYGALLASLLIGTLISFTGYIYSVQIAYALALIVYIAVLMLRPQGLLGGKK